MAKIITVPDPILRKISELIEKIDKKTLKIIRDLESTLESSESPKGVGLSGVQIGKPIRVFCTYLPPSGNPSHQEEKPIIKTYINPEITKTSKEKTIGPDKKKPILEGCLSIPNIWGPVWRHKWVRLKWQTKEGRWQKAKFQHFESRVIQHELDHLNGILFTDFSLKDNLPLYEYQEEKLVEISLP